MIRSDQLYKLKYDGFDLYQSNPQLHENIYPYAINNCIIHPDDIPIALLNQPVDYELIKNEIGLSEVISKKYNIFTLNTANHNISDCSHIVFNSKEENLTFIGIPSFDINGVCNNIALRLIEQDRRKIKHSFKWLFLCGNSSTFGLHDVNCSQREIIIVEGAWDYIAMRELGYDNVVSIGSIFMSDNQRAQLNETNCILMPCLDNDLAGRLHNININKKSYYSYCEEINTLDIFDMWKANIKIQLVKVN